MTELQQPIIYHPYNNVDERIPRVVDAVLPLFQTLRSGNNDPKLIEAARLARSSNELALTCSKQIILLCREYDVAYAFATDASIPIDASPGQNTVNLYPELVDRRKEDKILADQQVDCRYPVFQTAYDFAGRPKIGLPFVIKDIEAQGGINKLLVLGEAEQNGAKTILMSRSKRELEHVMVEEFVETPGDFPSTFRITATPTGELISATLKVGDKKTGAPEINVNAFRGRVFDMLLRKVPPRALVSNYAQGGVNYPLHIDDNVVEHPQAVDPNHQPILDAYGIDPVAMALPERIQRVASGVAQHLGPAYGLVFGIDLAVAKNGEIHLLEINNSPSLLNTKLTVGLDVKDTSIYLAAAERTIPSMANWPRF